jgi:hypothetical protein
MSQRIINQQVIVTSLGFRRNLVAYPRRMEFQGVSYSFVDAGLRCVVRCGSKISEIITLSDGKAQYRLRSDNNGASWMLLSIV